jgi:hypothetical protein
VESSALVRLGERIGISDIDVQDWDLVCADAERVDEFCDLYDSGALPDEERQMLMRLIVASLDELLSRDSTTVSGHRVESLLKRDRAIHASVIRYWASGDEDPVWRVTPMMRRVRDAE